MADQAQQQQQRQSSLDGRSQHIASGLAALLNESRQLASMSFIKEQQNSPATRKRLLQLCDRVAALELTVEMIQNRLNEEASVVAEMEQLEQRAMERRHTLIGLFTKNQNKKGDTKVSPPEQSNQHYLLPSPLKSLLPYSSLQQSSSGSSNHRHSLAIQYHQPAMTSPAKTPTPPVVQIHFERITKDELERSIPRTMRSGISVAMLNDALSDVELLLDQTGDTWVTEQEIRQYCSFFRYGEATARAMLLLLCNLHRLSQRPEKGGDFIYQVSGS